MTAAASAEGHATSAGHLSYAGGDKWRRLRRLTSLSASFMRWGFMFGHRSRYSGMAVLGVIIHE